MKKFTFLLSLLLASSGVTASAQSFTAKAFKSLGEAVTDVNALQDGAYYAFKCNSKRKFIKIENPDDNKHFANDNDLTDDDVTDVLAVFKLHKVGDKFQFETALSGLYIPALSNNQTAYASETAGTFTIGKTDLGKHTTTDADLFAIAGDNSVGFDMQDGQFVGWNAGGDQAWYKIYPVTVDEIESTFRKVSFTIQNEAGTEDATLAQATSVWSIDGKTITPAIIPSKASAWYTFSVVGGNNVVGAENANMTFKLTEGTAPFTYSTADNRSWYLMRFNKSDNNYLSHAKASDENLYIQTKINSFASVAANADKAFWSIEKNGYGVKIYNKEAGKYLTVATGKNQEKVTLSDEGSVFIVRNNVNNGAYSLQLSGNANACFGFHTGAYAGVWNNGGSYNAVLSNCEFYPVFDKAKSYLVNDIETANTNANLLGVIVDASKKAELKAEAETATNWETLVACNAKIPVNKTPVADAYYQVKSVCALTKGNPFMSTKDAQVDGNGALVAQKSNASRVNASACSATTLWKLVANNDNSAYYLYNVNLNAYLGKITADKQGSIAMVTNQSEAGTYTLNFREANKFNLVLGDHCINAYNGKEGTGLGVWDEDGLDGEGNNWQLEKVDAAVTAPITDAKYATVAFPFATKVTTDGVKAYYATGAADGMITLVEYPEGIIPANEGALLYNEAGATTANLEIVTTDKAVEGNKLMPATAKRTGFTANSTYVLAKNAANEAAFLKNSLTVVPANKAYIAAETIPADNNGSNVLNFNFGQVTGINAVVAADKAGVQYFDLQGRRVLYPTHGIFVTNTGKKVFVK